MLAGEPRTPPLVGLPRRSFRVGGFRPRWELNDLGSRREPEASRLREGLNEPGHRLGSNDLPMWKLDGVNPRPLSRCGSRPCGFPSQPSTLRVGAEDSVRIARVICTHPIAPLPPSFSTDSRHLLTTSLILGRPLGFYCQQFSRRVHMSLVNRTFEFLTMALKVDNGPAIVSNGDTRLCVSSVLS